MNQKTDRVPFALSLKCARPGTPVMSLATPLSLTRMIIAIDVLTGVSSVLSLNAHIRIPPVSFVSEATH